MKPGPQKHCSGVAHLLIHSWQRQEALEAKLAYTVECRMIHLHFCLAISRKLKTPKKH